MGIAGVSLTVGVPTCTLPTVMRNIKKVAVRRLGAAVPAFLVATVVALGLSFPSTIAAATATSLSIDGLTRGGTLVVPPCLPTNDPTSVQFSFTMRGAGFTPDQTVTVVGQSSTGDRYGPFVRVVKADGTFVLVVNNFWISARQTIQLQAATSVDAPATFLFIAIPSDATGGTLPPPWTPQPELEPTATPLQAETYTDSDIMQNSEAILATPTPTHTPLPTLPPRPTERPAPSAAPSRTQTTAPTETATATASASSTETPEASPTTSAAAPSPSAVVTATTPAASATPTVAVTRAARETPPPATATATRPALATAVVVATSTPAADAPPVAAPTGQRGWVVPAVIVVVLGFSAAAGVVLLRRRSGT